MKKTIGILALAALVLATLGAGEGTQYSGLTTMTFRQDVDGYAGWADTYMTSVEADSANNYGASTRLYLGRGFRERALAFSVNLFGLPDSATIVSLRAFWFADTLYGTSVPKCRVYRSLKDWEEGTADGAAQAGSCDWNDYGAGQWYTPGGKFRGLRSGPEAQTYASFNTTGADTTAYPTRWWGMDTDTTLTDPDTPYIETSTFVPKNANLAGRRKGWFSAELQHQAWLYHKGANTNLGWLVFANEEAGTDTTLVRLRSSEWAEEQFRPYVVATFFDPDTVVAVHDTVTVGTTTARLGIGNGIGKR